MIYNSFIGVWKLLRFEFRKENGDVIYPFGVEAKGQIIYTEAGHFSGQLMRIDRPKFVIPDQMKGTSEEIEVNYKGSISYFGTYVVNVEKAEIVHAVEGSIFPNMEGTEQKRSFEFHEDRLLLQTPPFKVGGEKAIGILEWKKVE